MAFFILPLLSARDLDIGPRDDISRGLITSAIWKRPCINLFITYFARADNMLLPFTRGQITCYFPRKMLLPWGQITRRKLCFYYTCKFGVISIKYVIINVFIIIKLQDKQTWYTKVVDGDKYSVQDYLFFMITYLIISRLDLYLANIE